MGLAFPFHPDEDQLAVEASGNAASFVALYRRYYPRIYNYIRYRCDDLETTEDLVAQTFERALANLSQFRPSRGPFGAWLFAIARNTVAAHRRTKRRHFWLAFDDLANNSSGETGPEDTVLIQEKHGELLEALQKLGERERDLLGLKFAGQLSNRQIAELTGLGESNVGVILYRAIQRLRADLAAPMRTVNEPPEQTENIHGRP